MKCLKFTFLYTLCASQKLILTKFITCSSINIAFELWCRISYSIRHNSGSYRQRGEGQGMKDPLRNLQDIAVTTMLVHWPLTGTPPETIYMYIVYIQVYMRGLQNLKGIIKHQRNLNVYHWVSEWVEFNGTSIDTKKVINAYVTLVRRRRTTVRMNTTMQIISHIIRKQGTSGR